MTLRARRRKLRRWAALLVGAALLCGSGCAAVGGGGNSFVDEYSHWTENLRPHLPNGNPYLHSDRRSYDIERNLGVR
jgi:hypothetical protein